MFNREKKTKKIFFRENNQINKNLRNSLKNKCIMVAFIQKMEYAQQISGRCISYRSKRNGIDSIVIRNKKFGTEVRFIIKNPRFIILI
jgi:hypothetical protein